MRGQWANKRDTNEPDIVAKLRAHGFCVVHMDKPVDLLIGRAGRTWIAEVKMPKGELTGPQERFYKNWRGNHLILRSTKDADEFSAEVKKEMT